MDSTILTINGFLFLGILSLVSAITAMSYYYKAKRNMFITITIGWLFWGASYFMGYFISYENALNMFIMGIFGYIGGYYVLVAILHYIYPDSTSIIRLVGLILASLQIILFFINPDLALLLVFIFQSANYIVPAIIVVIQVKKLLEYGFESLVYYIVLILAGSLHAVNFSDEPETDLLFNIFLNATLIFLTNLFYIKIENNIGLNKLDKAKEHELEYQKLIFRNEKISTIGTFTASIAHNFNNLLMIIMGSTSILRHKIENKDYNINEELMALEDAGKKSSNLISKIMILSRSKVVQSKIIHFDNSIAEITEHLVKNIDEKLSIITKFNCPEYIEFDPVFLDQTILNLYSNSKEAIEISENKNNGTISIETNVVSSSEIKSIDKTNIEKYAHLMFIDNGIGFSNDQKSKIFDPFFTTKPKGTGLGLSSVYSYIIESDGVIDVVSTINQGTIFHIYLPIVEKKEDKITTEIDLTLTDLHNKKILYVEDEEAIRRLSGVYLNEIGFQVDFAQNGNEGFTLYNENKYDLIITDLLMPGLDGMKLYYKIRAENEDQLILMNSGYANYLPEIEELIKHDDKLQFIMKPFTVDDLHKKVVKFLSIVD